MDTFIRKGHEKVRFFVGPEIEQTPAFGKKTLFVVGLQDLEQIIKLAREHKCPHIFLSANRSFDSLEDVDGQYKVGDTLACDWEVQIHKLLDQGFMVSLDYPAHKHVDVLKVLGPAIWQSRNFVPVLSVAIPKINTSSVNLTVKIDDSNFKATNPGVWCMNHTEVTDSNRFTSWDEYGDDLIIETSEPVIDPGPTGWTGGLKVPVGTKIELPDAPVPVADPAPVMTKAEPASADINDGSLGLDPTSESKLKPETEEEKALAKPTTVVETGDVLNAYTEGTTSDPLSAPAEPKKKVTSKKA